MFELGAAVAAAPWLRMIGRGDADPGALLGEAPFGGPDVGSAAQQIGRNIHNHLVGSDRNLR